MSTLAEIEAALPELPDQDLASLEQAIRKLKRSRVAPPPQSWRDLKPFHGGKMLKPLGPDDDILGEMIEAKWPYPERPYGAKPLRPDGDLPSDIVDAKGA